MQDWWFHIGSGFVIGAMGSFHCIGMCGPLALTITAPGNQKLNAWQSITCYNLGRSLTYAIMGILFGLIGSQLHIWGLQQFITILAGITLLVMVLMNSKFTLPPGKFAKFFSWLQNNIQHYLQKPQTAANVFVTGMMNGLLPCGLVYMAIVAALATGNTWQGSILMLAFGFGTIPMMAGVMWFGRSLDMHRRHQIRRAMPYFISIMACLLILRGMNLGIPFVSPKMGPSTKEIPSCHGTTEVRIFPLPE